MEEYFAETETSDKMLCKICNKILNSKRSFNLKAHLKNQHRIEISKNQVNGNKIEKRTKNVKVKLEINKHEIIRAYVGLVTESGIPFEALNSDSMKTLLNPISSALSANNDKMFTFNGDNAKKILSNVVIKLRNIIKDELSNQLFSLKIDSATRLNRSIFGISLQYCKDSNIISRMIGMVELKGIGSARSKNLATEIMKTLSKYDLSLQQVISITSDNGANMLKTTSLLSKCLLNYDNGENDDEFIDNDEYQLLLDEIANDSDINIGEIVICRCAAHTAQLVALDAIKIPNIKSFVLQCRNLTKFIRKPSNGIRYLFDLNKLRIPQIDCPTRWGSTYRMISDLKSSRTIIEGEEIPEFTSHDDPFEINEKFWEYVEDFLLVFKPLNDVLIKFQAESLHYGDFYGSWLKCKLLIAKIVEESSEISFSKMIGESVLHHYEKRSSKLFANDIVKACLYMDPRFQHTLTPDENNIAVEYLKKTWDKFSLRNKEFTNNVCDSIESQEINQEDDILTAFLRQNIFENIENMDTHTKIDKLKLPFLKSDTCVLKYWKDRSCSDPELYILSNIIFGVPPTQVTVERAFSSLRIILTENRNRLSAENLENILLAKLNPSLLNDAISELEYLK